MKSEASFEKRSLLLFGFSMLTNVVNYAFQILSARALTVADYGLLNTIISIIFILGVPGQAFQLYVAKTVSEKESGGGGSRLFVAGFAVFTAVVVCGMLAVGLALSPVIDGAMSVGSLALCALMTACVAVAYPRYVATGVAQGLQRFVIMPVITMIEAVLKVAGIGFAVLFVTGGDRLFAMLIFLALGSVLAVVFGWFALRRKLGGDKPSFSEAIGGLRESVRRGRLLGASLALNLCVVFMMYSDVLIVRLRFDEGVSGLYGSAAQFGKILVFAVTALINVFLPMVSRSNMSDKGGVVPLYLRALLYILLTSAVFMAPILLFPGQIVSILVGGKYISAVGYINYSCAIGVSTTLNMLNMNYAVARGRLRFPLAVSVAGAALAFWLGYNQTSPEAIAVCVASVGGAVFVINMIYIIKGDGSREQ
ncbi:MAG: hypothetical protein LBK41_02135 [Clostridiales bacterium]|nr:hypothetical protein [Clostridiales bacterium]